MIGNIIGAVGSLASTYLEGKVANQKSKAEIAKAEAIAKADILKTAATHEANWEKVMASASSDSWKDEAWTILFIAIIAANFIPFLQPYVAGGFEALDKCPDWFQWAMYASIAASFGLRGIHKFRK